MLALVAGLMTNAPVPSPCAPTAIGASGSCTKGVAVKLVDATGAVTRLRYDDEGRVIASIRSYNEISTAGFDNVVAAASVNPTWDPDVRVYELCQVCGAKRPLAEHRRRGPGARPLRGPPLDDAGALPQLPAKGMTPLGFRTKS